MDSKPLPPEIPERTSPAIDPAGRVTLRGYKAYSLISEETPAFYATIVLDGKKIGTVRNTGTGGPHRFDFKTPEAQRSITELAEQWATKNNESSVEQLDGFIDYLVTGIEDRKIARPLYRKVLEQCGDAGGVVVIEKSPIYVREGSHIVGFGIREYIVTSTIDDTKTLAVAQRAEAWRFHVLPYTELVAKRSS